MPKEYVIRKCHGCEKPIVVGDISDRLVCTTCQKGGHDNCSKKRDCILCCNLVWYNRYIVKIAGWYEYAGKRVKSSIKKTNPKLKKLWQQIRNRFKRK